MKGITVVQAFHYWAKVFAISLPLFVVMSVLGGYGSALNQSLSPPKAPLAHDTTLTFKGKADAPSNAVAFSAAEPSRILYFSSEKPPLLPEEGYRTARQAHDSQL